MMDEYPDLAKVSFPADFPLLHERSLLENVQVAEKSKAKLVIDKFQDLLLKTIDDPAIIPSLIRQFGADFDQISSNHNMEPLSCQQMDQLMKNIRAQGLEDEVFNKYDAIFKLAVDQRYIVKVYLDYIDSIQQIYPD